MAVIDQLIMLHYVKHATYVLCNSLMSYHGVKKYYHLQPSQYKYPALDKIWYMPFLDIYNLHRDNLKPNSCTKSSHVYLW